MTELTITPKIADKTARFKGAVAAGEHVAVTIKGGAEWLGEDGDRSPVLRVIDCTTRRTLAVFPYWTEDNRDDWPDGVEEPDAWETSGGDEEEGDAGDLACTLNLNTLRMVAAARHMLRVPVLFVLGDAGDPRTLYFCDRHEVMYWPERIGDTVPYDLDRWPKQIDEWTDLIAEFETRIDAAEDSIRDAVDEANGIVAHVDDAKTVAQNSATAAGDSASAAQTSAATAKNWATGGGETGDPGATNNAKYYAQQAGASAISAEASATAAAGSATSAEGSATSAAGSATAAASSAQSAAGAAEAAVETEKERAEGAESDLADAIVAEKERAEGAEALAIVSAEYNSTSRLIVFTTSGGETKTIDASVFIKDGMISSVSVSNGNLVITFNSDAGKRPISIPLTQIFNPSNYYDKTAADGTFVKKDGAKVLSTEDYTTAEKSKLAGIAPNANAYVLPPATSSALGGVKQGTGCTIENDGTLNVTGEGGGGTVDDTVTRTGANPVKSSGIWSTIWGALTALPTGFASLYEWCVAQLAGKLSTSGGTMTGRISALLASLKLGTDPTFARFTIPGATNEHYMCFGYKDGNFGLFVKNGSGSAERFYALPSSSGDIAMIQDLAGKADAADLRYRIAEAGFKHQFAALAFPITYMNTITSTPVTITAGDADDITWDVQLDGGAYVLYNGFDFAYFNSSGDYGGSQPGEDLQFNGVAATNAGEPLVQTLADRAVNLITADDETSLDIELPAAVTVDGVSYARDFFLDIDNSANSSDLALEFTALGVDYAFAPLEDDSISEMMTIGAGERVRLYFTETPYLTGTGALPVINVARVTLGDFVTSTTQGGN